jgi:hypothetical protein
VQYIGHVYDILQHHYIGNQIPILDPNGIQLRDNSLFINGLCCYRRRGMEAMGMASLWNGVASARGHSRLSVAAQPMYVA